jgi:hypothetical protein
MRGRNEVSSFISQLQKDMETKLLRGAARAGGKVVADEIKERSKSEEVRDNLRMRTSAAEGRVTVRIDVKPGWARSLAIWAEYGTAPHLISVDESQRSGMSIGRINRLAKDEDSSHSLVIGGRFVGTTVLHPGAQPYPAFRPALDIKQRDAIATAQAYINNHVAPSGIKGDAEGEGEDV